MNRRAMGTMALVAGGVSIAAIVALSATGRPPAPMSSLGETLDRFEDLVRTRLNGDDSAIQRRALRAALRHLPDEPLVRALAKYADKEYSAAAAALAGSDVPIDGAVRGCCLWELSRREEAAEELKRALEAAPRTWKFRSLFDAVLHRLTVEAPVE
ncbi:MAG: hypothetical protein HY716_05635 [Planctomycetes bacterium]|nr:hypothetical protein [Planctomycetota bacterium]